MTPATERLFMSVVWASKRQCERINGDFVCEYRNDAGELVGRSINGNEFYIEERKAA